MPADMSLEHYHFLMGLSGVICASIIGIILALVSTKV